MARNENETKSIDEEFEQYIQPIISHPNFQKQKQIPHHHHTTVYEHVLTVAKICFIVAKKSKKKYDMQDLIYGALLHDYFLYNWREEEHRIKPHGFKHPIIAIQNASKDFELTPKMKSIIRTHMWPLTFLHIPICKEGWLVSIADKLVTYNDFIEKRKLNKNGNQRKKENE